MKNHKNLPAGISFVIMSILLSAQYCFSQTLPTAQSIAEEMGIAWNLGNTMEAPGGATGWGNPVPTQKLIDSVKAGGFNTVRIPCAWDGHADQTTLEIDPSWMAQVKQVVDFCIKDSLFVVLNIHWDGGWLQNRVDSAVIDTELRSRIHQKQGAYWSQIATAFRDYDRHLLFASTNEPAVENAEAMDVLNSFHQTFIDTVRATGGNNASRTLVVQGPNTALEDTYELMNTLPTDVIEDRLMVEVHYYPYQFCLMKNDADWGNVFYYWGQPYHSPTDTDRNATWGEESYTDSVFNLMKMQFTDKNVPVLLGEFGAMKRLTLRGENLERHILSRRYFYEYVASSSKQHGIIPVAWDAGGKGDGTMTVFDRETGEVYDLGILNAMRHGWGMPKLAGDTSVVQGAQGDNSMKVLYSSKDSLFGQVSLPVAQHDVTGYDSIIVRAYVNGETQYDSAGTTKAGYVNLSLVTMSDNWTWRQAPFAPVVMDDWVEYSIPFGTDTADENALVPAAPAQIDFFAVQAFSRGYRGTIYIDWIVLKSDSGISDTVYDFNAIVPEEGSGNVESIHIIPTGEVEFDDEWIEATTRYPFALDVFNQTNAVNRKTFRAFSKNGTVFTSFNAARSGVVNITLLDMLGKTIVSHSIYAKAGLNNVDIPSRYTGVMILQIRQGSRISTGRVICH